MRTQKDFNHQNEYNRMKYDRIGIMLPKGKGAEWKAEAERRNISLNAFITNAVNSYIENCTTSEEAVQDKKIDT